MASRKSPSQRDPMTRMSQAVRAGSPASMGGRVANATPVQAAATPNRRVVTGTSSAPPSDVASIYLYGSDLGALTRGSVEVTNAQFRDNGCTLAVELTCEAGTVVTVDATAPGSPETLVAGAVFGTGRIAKVRNTTGATVTPAAWNMGNWTHVPGNAWVGSAANNADFTFAGGAAVQLVLGGTYLFSLVLFLP